MNLRDTKITEEKECSTHLSLKVDKGVGDSVYVNGVLYEAGSDVAIFIEEHLTRQWLERISGSADRSEAETKRANMTFKIHGVTGTTLPDTYSVRHVQGKWSVRSMCGGAEVFTFDTELEALAWLYDEVVVDIQARRQDLKEEEEILQKMEKQLAAQGIMGFREQQ